MNLIAQRQIEIQSLSAVLTLKVGEVRPEIISYLNGDRSWINSIEQSVFESLYLDKYLGLYKNGRLTPEGQRVRQFGKVFIPEHGLYKLLFVNNRILGNIIINYKRLNPTKNITEKNTDPFEGYKDYQGNYYKTLDGNEIDFIIQFHLNRSNKIPRVVWNNELIGKISIESSSMTGTSLYFQYQNKEYIDHNYSNFDLDINLTNLISGWDPRQQAVEKNFGELNLEEKDKFQTGFTLNEPLYIDDSLDSSSWQIHIQNVPILPKTKLDAEKWLEYLLIKTIDKEKAYITYEHIDQLQKKIIANTPLAKKYTSLWIPTTDFHERITNTNPIIYNDIQTAQDLIPEIEA